MEEIRIKIHGRIPYYIVMDVIGELLDKCISEDTSMAEFEMPYNSARYRVLYCYMGYKLFDICKIQ